MEDIKTEFSKEIKREYDNIKVLKLNLSDYQIMDLAIKTTQAYYQMVAVGQKEEIISLLTKSPLTNG